MPADRQIEAARKLIKLFADALDVDGQVQLWDGKAYALGEARDAPFIIKISSPGVIGNLIRRPKLDTLIQHYARSEIDFDGISLIDFGHRFNDSHTRRKMRAISKSGIVKSLIPFVTARLSDAKTSGEDHAFKGEETGKVQSKRDNKEFVQFHYDLSNDFYQLFLDPNMQYSCAYFKDWSNDLAQAQADKLEIICRKLRLKPGERLLDIGCGWGGLICYAAKNFGVQAHGVTLSEEQFQFARERINELSLQKQITITLQDYGTLEGKFDKIASVGMYEHIGLANIPAYMKKVRQLLEKDGLFLNHAIARRAKKKKRLNLRTRPEKRAIAKYIFPGGELDNIGHSLQEMEKAGFEVQDVEALREHYALTTRLWYQRLSENADQAIAHVGPEKYRIWLAYLAGVSLAFSRGSLLLFQTLVSFTPKGAAPLPPTRSDLYSARPDLGES